MQALELDVERGFHLDVAASLHDLSVERTRRECIESLASFVAYAWPYADKSTYKPNWHIEVVCDHLEMLYRGDIRNLVINIPPGHAKSLLSSVFFPAWIWLQDPSYQMLFASREKTLTTRDSVRCRDLIRSDWYQDLIRHAWAMKKDQDEKTYYVNTRGGFRYSLSVGGGAAGWRGDLRCVDDPIDTKERTITTQALQDVIDWWHGPMSTRLNDPSTARSLVIMQRVHDNDLCGYIERECPGDYVHLKIPAEHVAEPLKNQSPFFEDPRTEVGELLFPDHYPREEIERLKVALGSYSAAGQLQQDPTPRTGGIIKKAWINYYSDLPKTFTRVIQSWDCAVEESEDSSWVVGQVWGAVRVDGVERYYLIDQMREHAGIVRNIGMIRSLLIRHPETSKVYIEKKANGAPILQLLTREFDELLEGISPVGSKDARLRAVSPLFERGTVLLPLEADWVGDLVSELTAAKPENDDQRDTTAQALDILENESVWAWA